MYDSYWVRKTFHQFQTEAPILIRPFLADMTKSELHAVMTGGFATIAGGVLAAYIGMGVSTVLFYAYRTLYNWFSI